MGIVFAEKSAVTVSTSAISLINGTTTIASLTTVALVAIEIDTTNVVAGDFFEVKRLEKVISGGTQRSISLGIIDGTQNGPFISPTFINGNGWDYTIIKLAGTDRAFDWSVREVS